MSSEDNLFHTLTSDDWKRGLVVARATLNDVSIQIKDRLSMLGEQVKREENCSEHDAG